MRRFCLASLACLLCLVPVRAQTPEMQAKVNAALYVKRLQTPDGGFVNEAPDPKSNRIPKASLRATSSAIRALKYLGGELPNADKCKKFVASCFDKQSGGFADMPGGTPDVFATAVGLMAVVELGLPAEPYHAAATKYLSENAKTFDDIRIAAAGFEAIKAKPTMKDEWLKVVQAVRLPEPGEDNDNGRARMGASKAVTLLRLGLTLDKDMTAKAIASLQRQQRPNGGYGKDNTSKSDLESTYRVMRFFVMTAEKPASVANLRNFIDKCRNEDGGYGVAPGQTSSISGTYYAAIIQYWLDGKK